MSLLGSIGGALLGGVGDLVNTGVNLVGQSILNNSSNAKAKRQATVSFIRQKQLIDEANEYNKPINQMSRLEEAGLNPNLVYENGAQTLSANIGAPPQAKVFSTEMPKLDILGRLQDIQNQQRLEEKTQAEINAINNGIDVQNENLNITRRLADIREKALALQERALNEREREFDLRNGDDVLDFIGGAIQGFGEGVPSQVGAKDVRPSMVLGQHVGKFMKKNGAKMFKNYKTYGINGLLHDLPLFEY